MTFFILGSHPELSMAEINAVVGDKPIVASTPDILVLGDVDESAQILQDRLAGTVKIGQVIGEMSVWNQDEAGDLIASFVIQAQGKNKISFGVSAYGMEREARELGKAVKARLKQIGRPVRFVTSKQVQLSSVIVEENGLLSSGGEYVLIKADGKILIGQTQTVQNYKAWSDRDYGRPARDAKSGMLPPKLARMMINLSGVESSGKTLLDPFCGSGTVLAEAMLLGFQTLIGSDISNKATSDTRKNIAWLAREAEMELPALTLYTHDARTLDEAVMVPVDVIVTEAYLGQPKKHALTLKELARHKKELFAIYETAFRAFSGLLATDGRIVMAVPAFKTQDGFVRLGVQDLFSEVGFRVRSSFFYSRPDQIVAREIFVLSLDRFVDIF